VTDLVLGPGQDGKTIQPEGLKASGMNAKQRAMLLDLISEWAGIVHESASAARMVELKADIGETWFAWSGETEATPGKNGKSYYRIQGPHLVIEYSPQLLGGGDPSNHIHNDLSRPYQRLRQEAHRRNDTQSDRIWRDSSRRSNARAWPTGWTSIRRRPVSRWKRAGLGGTFV
jgi:hypothetical protein